MWHWISPVPCDLSTAKCEEVNIKDWAVASTCFFFLALFKKQDGKKKEARWKPIWWYSFLRNFYVWPTKGHLSDTSQRGVAQPLLTTKSQFDVSKETLQSRSTSFFFKEADGTLCPVGQFPQKKSRLIHFSYDHWLTYPQVTNMLPVPELTFRRREVLSPQVLNNEQRARKLQQ